MRRDVFQAIADQTRRAIIALIAIQAMTPSALAEHFDTSRQAVSKHLRILTECELVRQDQQGREIFYSLEIEKMKEIDDPVVLLHGSFMTITNNWTAPWGDGTANWIGELSKTRKVIAVEMQGHGRTADIKRDFRYENLADDVAVLLDHLDIPKADLVGYSMGGSVAMQCAIRHPEKVRKAVIISSAFRLDGMVKEAVDMFPKLTAEMFKGSIIETEYKKLSPTPDEFPNFVKHVISVDLKPYDFGADKLKATRAPMFFIHGDADGVRLDHISEMYRLKGGGNIHGDMGMRPASRLAVLPDTTHVTLMNRGQTIIPMINDFLDAKPSKQ